MKYAIGFAFGVSAVMFGIMLWTHKPDYLAGALPAAGVGGILFAVEKQK